MIINYGLEISCSGGYYLFHLLLPSKVPFKKRDPLRKMFPFRTTKGAGPECAGKVNLYSVKSRPFNKGLGAQHKERSEDTAFSCQILQYLPQMQSADSFKVLYKAQLHSS